MSKQATAQKPQANGTPSVSGVLQRACACATHSTAGGECETCKKKTGGETVQRWAKSSDSLNQAPPIVDEVLHSSGRTLDAETREFFESRFAHDFSRVRVHTDAPRYPLGLDPITPAPTAQAARGILRQTQSSGQALHAEDVLKGQRQLSLAQDSALHSGKGYIEAPVYPRSGTCEVGRSESNCFPDAGYLITAINNNCCTRPCTVEHEVQHVRDFDNCCKAYSRALRQPGADQLKLGQTWDSWREQVRPISECRAYTNDIGCAQRLAKLKGCAPETGRAEKAGLLASSGATATGNSEGFTEGTAQLPPLASPEYLDEMKKDFPKLDGMKELSACCIDIAWYEQAFRDEAAAWCKSAGGKAIPPCPFTAKDRKP
jgi:hypothetical protein